MPLASESNGARCPTRMALAWCYTKWQVASTIIGVTSVAQLDESLAAVDLELTAEQRATLDAAG